MKLVDPTDFEILSALSDGRRNTAANLAASIEKNRAYINTRLPVLADYGLVERVGPSPNSGLYEITCQGQTAVRNRDAYGAEGVDFEAIVERADQADAVEA